MIAILQLLAILVIGYLGTHFVAERIRARFHVVTGVEFVVLGVLVGPYATGVMTGEVLTQLGPVTSLAIGAIGLVLGLEMRLGTLFGSENEALELSFYGVASTALLVGGLSVLSAMVLLGPDWTSALPAAIALGAAAAVANPDAVATVRRKMAGGGKLGRLLAASTRFDQVLATLLFGLVFCVFHVGQTQGIRDLTITEWMVVSVGSGVVLGVLFFLFLGRERDPQHLLLALIGIIIFSSGTAYYLNLSPLLANLVLGMVLTNTSQRSRVLREVLTDVERPVEVVVLVLAGASWNLPALREPLVLAAIAVCLLGRPLGKVFGGWIAFRYGARRRAGTPRMGWGGLTHGPLAVAMAVNFTQVYQGVATDALFSAVLISVLAWEFLGPGRTTAVLVDAEPALGGHLEATSGRSAANAPS